MRALAYTSISIEETEQSYEKVSIHRACGDLESGGHISISYI